MKEHLMSDGGPSRDVPVTWSIADQPPDKSQNLMVGCILAICGNLVISVSLNLQKYIHIKVTDTSTHYARKPLWWLGLILMGLGEIGNFSAYGFAPASLVAPLGTTTVIANMVIARIFLKEAIKPQHVFGSCLAIVGAILLVTFSNGKERVLGGAEIQQYLKGPFLITYMSVEVALLAILLFLIHVRRVKFVVIYLLVTALLASFTVMSAKGASGMLQLSILGYPQFKYPIFYIMIVVMLATAIIQVKYLNDAMHGFDATVVVPTNFVFFTISAILGGIIFYKEFQAMTTMSICMFLFGCLLCFIGVYFITVRDVPVKPSPSPPHHSSQTSLHRTLSQISTVIPSWLTASVTMSPVQPCDHPVTMPKDAASPTHVPLFGDSSDDDTYAKNLPSINLAYERSSSPNYGSTDRVIRETDFCTGLAVTTADGQIT